MYLAVKLRGGDGFGGPEALLRLVVTGRRRRRRDPRRPGNMYMQYISPQGYRAPVPAPGSTMLRNQTCLIEQRRSVCRPGNGNSPPGRRLGGAAAGHGVGEEVGRAAAQRHMAVLPPLHVAGLRLLLFCHDGAERKAARRRRCSSSTNTITNTIDLSAVQSTVCRQTGCETCLIANKNGSVAQMP